MFSMLLSMTETEATMHLDRSVEIELRLLIEAIYLQYSYDF
ncbi:chemotaxis protein methyltransferase CheR, partial [Pseudomonas syringae pv. actinidiae ICMP 18807]